MAGKYSSGEWVMAYPNIAQSWNDQKNHPLKLRDTTSGSRLKVWWLCPKGHEWETTISNRIKGSGCPVCSNKKLLIGFNDLATTHPQLSNEWDSGLNLGLMPTDVVAGSKKLVWWRCPMNHLWEATVANRAQKNSGCLVCQLKVVVSGVNDLSTTHPTLAKEWLSTKNLPLRPDTVTKGYAKKVWWLCSKGHESFLSPFERSRRSEASKCQTCQNKTIVAGENDLAFLFPDLLSEWNYERNSPILPSSISAGAAKSVWWICLFGHEWKTSPAHRTVHGTGCPVCSKRIFLEGENDLQKTHPLVAAQWDYKANHPKKPTQITSGSGKKYWWLCEQSHSYSATPASRVHKNSGCPYCSSSKALKGFNDLTTTHPEIASQLVEELNGGLTGFDLTAGSRKIVFWKCGKGHVIKKDVRARVRTAECSVCSNYELLIGYNDLATVSPASVREWDYLNNGNLVPTGVNAFSEKSVWWICSIGHSYRQGLRVKAVQGSGCPVCTGKQVLGGYNDLATKRPELLELWNFERNLAFQPDTVTPSSSKRAWWRCERGHSWDSVIGNVSSGARCPSCAPGGFDQTKPGSLYFIENAELHARKIGITNQGIKTDRLAAFADMGWQVVQTLELDDGVAVRKLEGLVLNWIRKDCGLLPFLGRTEMGGIGGWKETFSQDGPTNAEVWRKVLTLSGQE